MTDLTRYETFEASLIQEYETTKIRHTTLDNHVKRTAPILDDAHRLLSDFHWGMLCGVDRLLSKEVYKMVEMRYYANGILFNDGALESGGIHITPEWTAHYWKNTNIQFTAPIRDGLPANVAPAYAKVKKGTKLAKGSQVAYIPTHANGDINHPDVDYGLVTSGPTSTGAYFVRYWREHKKGGELSPNSALTLHSNLYLYSYLTGPEHQAALAILSHARLIED